MLALFQYSGIYLKGREYPSEVVFVFVLDGAQTWKENSEIQARDFFFTEILTSMKPGRGKNHSDINSFHLTDTLNSRGEKFF